MLVEEIKEKRLKENKINIKTIFKDGNNILERNTDNSKNDTIKDGIILEKDYYQNGVLVKKENVFDSRMSFAYIFHGDEKYTCKNCGKTGILSDFASGCPYCNTNYNMDYHFKELGNKNNYDMAIKSHKYLWIILIIILLLSSCVTYLYITSTSRTMYFFDILKIVVGAILITLIIFSIVYYIDTLLILPSVKKSKESSNKRQDEFWHSMNYTIEEKTKFFNAINYALREFYYSDDNKNVIDFDIIDYNSFDKIWKAQNLYVIIEMDIRIVSLIDNKIVSKLETKKFRFKRYKIDQELKGGTNLIKCHKCNSSIDINKNECDYCGTPINKFQEWYLD